MATFTINLQNSFVNGTATNDTFNIDAISVTAFGLDGDDMFSVGNSTRAHSLDGGIGNDSFSLGSTFRSSLVFGGDGNDSVFMMSGDRNNFSGGAGNDWLGIGGGASSPQNTLDGGDGDDFVGATADSSWLFGGSGGDQLSVTGASNLLDGGAGNDSLFVAGGSNNILFAGDGNDWLGTNGSNHNLYGGAGDDWMGATGTGCRLYGESGNDTLFGVGGSDVLLGGDGNDWVGVSGGQNDLRGEAGNDYVAATGNNNTLDGGPGNDQLVAAAGHLNNNFIFRPGSGQDSITGFEGGAEDDVVDLRGFGLADFAALDPFMSQVGVDTVIALNGADILALKTSTRARWWPTISYSYERAPITSLVAVFVNRIACADGRAGGNVPLRSGAIDQPVTANLDEAPVPELRMEPLIRDISDTARWVAVYRARETERHDPLFRDPWARRLAGPRGERIADGMQFGNRHTWPWVIRTYLFDQFILEQIRQGVDMVVNLASGLDARPYRMALPASLRWVEVDLPRVLTDKEAVLAGEKPACILERIGLDLSDVGGRRELFAELGGRSQKVLIVTEGFTVYLTSDEVASLARDLADTLSFRSWALDLFSPGLIRLLQKRIGRQLSQGGLALRFAPREGPQFFAHYGWRPADVRSLLKTAARLDRLSLDLWLLAMLPQSNGAQGSFPWSGVCLFDRVG